MIRRTIHEWQHIAYGESKNKIPASHADQIAAEARASKLSGNNGERVLEHGRKGLRARGVVGVIASSGCQLEILPKIESANESTSEDDVDHATLRYRLVHMLSVARDIKIDVRAITQLSWQRDTILELLIRIFCNKLIEALRYGMSQQYIDHEEDLPTLRGHLDVLRQFSVLAVSPHKLACKYDARSPDITLNQVMRAAIGKLSRIAQAPDNQRALRELRFAYADISDVAPVSLQWDLIVLDRTNTRWRELLSLARLFLGNRHQQTNIGSIDGYALLFEMNILFEEYVGRLLTRALAGSNLRVSAQGGHRNCLFEGDTGRFRTRPDLIIRRGSRVDLLIDTKWKHIKGTNDPKWGVSQADIYQLMAYSQLYDCPNVMLLYPHHRDLPSDPVLQRYSIAKPNADENLIIATVDVTEPIWKTAAYLKDLVLCIPDRAIAA